MLDFLKQIKDNPDYDVIFFTPGEEDSQIEVSTRKYKQPGMVIDRGLAGDSFHIILFKENDNEEENAVIKHLDLFEAVLIEPLEYISELIPSDWYGVIARKTTTSKEFVDDLMTQFVKMT